MKHQRGWLSIAMAVAVVGVSACSSGASSATVRLQLQWAPQAQFAGYFAAVEQGYFTAENLTVTILDGGPDVIPQSVGCAGNAEFTISWVPKVLEARQTGCDLVNIAQVFQRSGTLSVSWKGENIDGPEDFAGKLVGAWGFGNEYEVIAAAKKVGLEEGVDYTKVVQPFDMELLKAAWDGCAAGDTDCVNVAEAMVYNEYAQILESNNPDTGQPWQPSDMNIIDYNAVGTAMLQDAIFVRESWVSQGTNADVATRFLRASFKGWIYCRDNPAKCVEYTLARGTTLPAGHQSWMMNEINPLIWPSPSGIGAMPVATWDQTVQISIDAGIISAAPPASAYRTDLAAKAREGIGDVNGTNFAKGTVAVTPGGN